MLTRLRIEPTVIIIIVAVLNECARSDEFLFAYITAMVADSRRTFLEICNQLVDFM
jgi:hypothetical protein